MDRTACTEPQCLYKGALYLYLTVELYLYSPYGPYGLYRASVPVQGYTLPFLLIHYRERSCTQFPLIIRAQLGFSFACVVWWHCQLLLRYTAVFQNHGSARNHKEHNLKYRQKFPNIPRNIAGNLSRNWQYWNNLRKLPAAYLFPGL